MRPKKRVLLVGIDDYEISPLRFLLDTRGYLALSAENAADAEYCVTNDLVGVELAIVLWPFSDAKAMIRSLRVINPNISIVVLHPSLGKIPLDVQLCADASLPKNISASELLERVKVWSQKKRGPKISWEQRETKPVASERAAVPAEAIA